MWCNSFRVMLCGLCTLVELCRADHVGVDHLPLLGRGGKSAVYTNDGDRLATLTLTSPGEILMGDDRNTTHSVTPIHPRTLMGQGHRDVLVIAFTAETEQTSAREGRRRPLP